MLLLLILVTGQKLLLLCMKQSNNISLKVKKQHYQLVGKATRLTLSLINSGGVNKERSFAVAEAAAKGRAEKAGPESGSTLRGFSSAAGPCTCVKTTCFRALDSGQQ